jgi:hypothetical protein
MKSTTKASKPEGKVIRNDATVVDNRSTGGLQSRRAPDV